jgi:hypothetical protein
MTMRLGCHLTSPADRRRTTNSPRPGAHTWWIRITACHRHPAILIGIAAT